MSILTKIANGTSYTMGAQIVLQIIQFGVTMILARLLTPEQFGIIAMVMVFRGLLTIFLNTGLTAALVQRKHITDSHLNVTFTIQVGIGSFLFILSWFSASMVADFFGVHELLWMIRVAGSGFHIGPLGAVHRAIMQREMRFSVLSKVQIFTAFITHSTIISLAYAGLGVWAIIWGNLIGSAGTVPVLWILCKVRPKPQIDKVAFTELFGFSIWVFFTNIINYLSRNVDNILIGKFISPYSLGFYNMAYNLMMLPLENISYPLKNVLFPVFSSVQDRLEELQIAYMKVLKYISIITFPAMLGLFSVAPQFIPLAYGSQWDDAIPIVQILAFVGIMQSICVPAGSVIISSGNSSKLFVINLVSCFLHVISFVAGLPWGVLGVALAYAVANIFTTVIIFAAVKYTLHIHVVDIIKSLLPASIASGAMCVILFFVIKPVSTYLDLADGLSLVVDILVGALIYIGLTHILANQESKELRAYLRQRFGFFPKMKVGAKI